MSKRALVTGAARRIGRYVALHLAKAGWDIVIHFHHSATEAETLAHAIRALDREAWLAEIDLGEPGAVRNLVPMLVREIGPLDALINNASLFAPDTEDPDGHRHRAINLEAPRLLSEALYRTKIENGSLTPSIINLVDAHPGILGFEAYGASKRELEMLTKHQAMTFAPDVRVNAVALGYVLPAARQSQSHFDEGVASTPLRETVRLEDVAAGITFLLESGSVTGEVVRIDGGLHLLGHPQTS